MPPNAGLESRQQRGKRCLPRHLGRISELSPAEQESRQQVANLLNDDVVTQEVRGCEKEPSQGSLA